MTDRPGSDDDDKAPPLPEVTVPPWLRTGPMADPSVTAATHTEHAAEGSATGSAAGSAEVPAERAAQGGQNPSLRVPPARIRLGAGRRTAAVEDAPGQADAAGAETSTPESQRLSRSRFRPQDQHRAESAAAAAAAAAGGPSDGVVVDDLSTLPLRTVPGAAAPVASSARPSPARPSAATEAPGPTPTSTARGATDTAAATAAPATAPATATPLAPASTRPAGTASPVASDSAPVGPGDGRSEDSPPPQSVLSRRPVRLAMLAVAGVAVLGGSAVLGFVVTRGASEPGPAPVAVAATSDCAESVEDGRVVGSGPGSLDNPAGAVLAFDHAYYVDRSAEKAFDAVAPSSRMTVEQLRAEGIDRLDEGTTHCVEVRELAPTLLEVDLTEFPPESEPVLIRQRVRVAESADGTWGIVSITPAG